MSSPSVRSRSGAPYTAFIDGDGLLDPFPLGVVQPGGDLVGALVDHLRVHALGQVDGDEPALVEHRDGRAVLDGPGQVVDRRCSSPNTACVFRSASEIGVPVNAMSVACGSASRRWRAYPSRSS